MDQTPSSPLGEYIRRQRELQKLSMRQLAAMAGISNPYLSQIERGLRDPSEKVLVAIARNLELSAEALHARTPGAGDAALLEVYRAFRAQTQREAERER
jgi:transcriptional regulator with XRE-family HTH domain